MNDVVDYGQPLRSGGLKQWIWLIPVGLVLAGCLFWTGLFSYLPALPQIWSNHLSRVQGKAELVAPAQWRFNRAELSQDGRWLALFATTDREKAEAPFVWDLATKEKWHFNLAISDIRWLTANQFAIVDTGSDKYYLADAGTMTITPALIYASDFAQVQSLWWASEQVYALQTFSMSSYTILTLEHSQPYIYRGFNNLPDTEVKQLIDTVPHIDVPRYGWLGPVGTDVRIASPDNRFYATSEIARTGEVNERVAIYTREGELVAEAYKAGWQPYILGWAHDGSGVYFRMRISGDAANVLVPYQPVFKLVPLTPAEERWALAKTIALWAAVVGVPAGVVWWWRRRRRARQP
jgi:hypothetical protein